MSWQRKLDRVRIRVGDETRGRHLAMIDSALDEAKRPARRHGRTLAIALAVVLTVPVIALAAENAQPGDFLYPVRQVFDPGQRGGGQPGGDEQDLIGPRADHTGSTTPARPIVTVDRDVPDHPLVTRPPSPEPEDTRPRSDERPTTTTTTRPPTTTTVPETTTTKPDRTPPTKPPRDG